ncbi:MAG TPA: gluconolaconase, partial [Acidobacteriota bacterium]|nr:gluconolaconase [Acidobacteriota bacterium]
MTNKHRGVVSKAGLALFAAGLVIGAAACSKKPDWAAKNKALIAAQNLAVRARADIPEVRLKPHLADGVVTPLASLPEIAVASGVKARLYWGKGNLIARLAFDPGAKVPEEILPAERIMVVMKGEIAQLLDGKTVAMRAVARETPDGTHGGTPRNDYLFLEKGSPNGIEAGPGGAEIIEVYWPPRIDYLKLAGVAGLPAEFPARAFPVAPTVPPGVVGDLNDVQFTELQPGANSRLIGGHGAQLSFLTMSPGMTFAAHLHPEEQLMTVFRGSIDE